jgi:hypothetical protein
MIRAFGLASFVKASMMNAEPPPVAASSATARDSQPKLDPASRRRIGRELRALYAECLVSPLTPRLAELLAQLEPPALDGSIGR